MRDNRGTKKYKEWKNYLLVRDNHQCKKCKSKNDLVAHHIKSWNDFPNLRYNLENGVILCKSCHAKKHYEYVGDTKKFPLKYLVESYKNNTDFKMIVDIFMFFYEKSRFTEIDFISALNYHTYLKGVNKNCQE